MPLDNEELEKHFEEPYCWASDIISRYTALAATNELVAFTGSKCYQQSNASTSIQQTSSNVRKQEDLNSLDPSKDDSAEMPSSILVQQLPSTHRLWSAALNNTSSFPSLPASPPPYSAILAGNRKQSNSWDPKE